MLLLVVFTFFSKFQIQFLSEMKQTLFAKLQSPGPLAQRPSQKHQRSKSEVYFSPCWGILKHFPPKHTHHTHTTHTPALSGMFRRL